MESDIRLFVSCHMPSYVPDNALLYPVHAGAALSEMQLPGFLRDDRGDNISSLNRRYCELTTLYWAWKNVEADYYGFFHYRRYLYPGLSPALPYCIRRKPTDKVLRKLEFDKLKELVPQYDLIVPVAEDMRVTVRDYYADAPYHHRKDLQLIEEIIGEKYPEYLPAMNSYLSGTKQQFMNIAIMRREVLQDYCSWLFPILREFDLRADTEGYNPIELRVNGYLGERLLGIYYTHRKADLNTLELPRVHFEDGLLKYYRRRLLNAVLRPGSLERAIVKRAVKVQKGVDDS